MIKQTKVKQTKTQPTQPPQIFSQQKKLPKVSETTQIDKKELTKLLKDLPPLIDIETQENDE